MNVNCVRLYCLPVFLLLLISGKVWADEAFLCRITADAWQENDPPKRLCDGNPNTLWHSPYEQKDSPLPHAIFADLIESLPVKSVTYRPRPDCGNGTAKECAIYVSDDFRNFGEPKLVVEVPKSCQNHVLALPGAPKGRYLKFEIRANHENSQYASCAEFSIQVEGRTMMAFVEEAKAAGNADNPFSQDDFLARTLQQAKDAQSGRKREATILAKTSMDTLGLEAWRAMDGDPNTVFRTRWDEWEHRFPSHLLQLGLGEPTLITGFVYTPPRDGWGEMRNWEFQVGESENANFQTCVRGQFTPRDARGQVVPSPGTKDEIENNAATLTVDAQGRRIVRFNQPVVASCVQLRVNSSQYRQPWVAIAEFELLGLDGVSLFTAAKYDPERQQKLEQLARNGHRPPCTRWECHLDLALRTLEFVQKSKPLPDHARRLADLMRKIDTSSSPNDLVPEIQALRREIIFQHPSLNFERILIAKRPPTGYSHQCDQYLGRHSGVGPGLVVLENWKQAAGKFEGVRVREVLKDKLPAGTVLNPDLSWDGTRVLFAFCKHVLDPKFEKGMEGTEIREIPADQRAFRIYEAAVDGSWVRPITGTESDTYATWENRKTVLIEDFDPCYLPDGGIAFVSTRCQSFGRCHGGRYTPTYMMYRCNGDGTNIHQLSWGEANEWAPSVLANGRLVYTRWDYINRHDTIFQSLWQMLPDGTGTAHYYGNYTPSPCMTIDALQVPNSRQTVCVAEAHHSYAVGSLILVDPMRGEDGFEPLTRITPEVRFPEGHDPIGGGTPGGYSTPFPISEDFFLAANIKVQWAWQGSVDEPNAYGIVLVDSLGGREEIYRDAQISSFNPIPLVSRPKPPAMPSLLPEVVSGEDANTGIFYVQDVYNSRVDLERGSAKALRINQIFGQPRNGKGFQSDANNEISKNVLGTVPVDANGSVAFRAPAGVPLQLQLLDENNMAIMTMRSFVYLQPGESNGCVGCHEQRNSTLSGYTQTRAMSPVQEIRPVPGTQYPGGLTFNRTVQPVLNRYCITCHGLERRDGNLDLTGIPEGNVTRAYDGLVRKKPGKWVVLAIRNTETATSVPKDYFAHRGELVSYLRGEHQKFWNSNTMDRASWDRIITWLDLNGQFHGDYESGRFDRFDMDGAAKQALLEYVRQELGQNVANQPFETLVSEVNPEESRVLLAPLATNAGGWGQISKWSNKSDPGWRKLHELVLGTFQPKTHFFIDGIPDDRYGGDWVRRSIDNLRAPVATPDWEPFNDRAPEGSVELGARQDGEPEWKVVRASSEETGETDARALYAIDGSESGPAWRTSWTEKPRKIHPHEIVIDLGKERTLTGLKYLPIQGLGDIKYCQIYVSATPDAPGTLAAQGFFRGRGGWQSAAFTNPVAGRYLTVRAISEYDGCEFASAREFRVWVEK